MHQDFSTAHRHAAACIIIKTFVLLNNSDDLIHRHRLCNSTQSLGVTVFCTFQADIASGSVNHNSVLRVNHHCRLRADVHAISAPYAIIG